MVKLFIDGKLVAQADVPVTNPLSFWLSGGLTCGSVYRSPATPDYQPPFEFTGKIHSVTVEVGNHQIGDEEAEMRIIMTLQ